MSLVIESMHESTSKAQSKNTVWLIATRHMCYENMEKGVRTHNVVSMSPKIGKHRRSESG